MAAKVQFVVEAVYDEKGGGFKSAIGDAEKFNAKQKEFQQHATTSSNKATMLASTVGNVSTSLARSVGVFGMSATSLRAIDDAADIAVVGMSGLTIGMNTAATATKTFWAAALGPIGAVGILSVALGTLIRKYTGLGEAMDKIADRGGFKNINVGSSPGNADALKRQIETLRAQGRTVDDIMKVSGDALKKALAPLAESDQIAMLEQLGFKTTEYAEVIPQLADNLKAEAMVHKEAATAAEEQATAHKEAAAAAEEQRQALYELSVLMREVGDEAAETVSSGLLGDSMKAGLDDLGDGFGRVKVSAEEMAAAIARGSALELQAAQQSASAHEATRQAVEETTKATFDWSQQLQTVANMAATLPGLFGKALSAILGGVAGIGASLKNIGGMKGLGGALKGARGLGGLLSGVGVIGSVIGGVVGIFKGIFGDAKKKAAELKKKQEEAMKAFSDLFEQWSQLRIQMAEAGAEGVNSVIDAMFKDGKLDESLTSAANAADYVAASFAMLRAAGYSTAAALAKLKPALEAMAKDAKKFAGSAAEPLLQMAQFAEKNAKLLQFMDGLAAMAEGLSAMGLLTQELTDKIAGDLSNAVQKMEDAGLSHAQALALSAEDLHKLQQAAEHSGTKLDDHTQKLIDDAEAAGLFEGLKDPMEQLVKIEEAMLGVMVQMVQLMGGQVPAAIQAMIDAFDSARPQSPTGAPGAPGAPAPGGEDEGGGRPGPEGFAEGSGGLRDFGRERIVSVHGREAITTQQDIERMIAAAAAGAGGGDVRLYLDGRQIAESTARHNRRNSGGTQTQAKRGYR